MEGLHRIDDEGAARAARMPVLAKHRPETGSTAQSLMIGFRICSLFRDNTDSPTYLPWKPCSEGMNDAGAKSSANPRRSTAE